VADDGHLAADLDGDAAVIGRPGRAAFVGQPAEILLRHRRWRRGREGRLEVGREPRQLDPVLGPARPGHGRFDAREIELEELVEGRSWSRFTPEALCSGVALDEFDAFGRPAGHAQRS